MKTTKKTTRFLPVTIFEAAELDATALLADLWDNDLDPDVSAQLVQASAQAYFSCREEKKGKVKVKVKARAREHFFFAHHVHQ